MADREYTLQDLTSELGVTARTIRYYISEGLLPPPVAAGPQSYYTDVHLDRLRLIAKLKEAYLPLREIRRQLDAMTDEEIASAVDVPATMMSAHDAAGDVAGSIVYRHGAGTKRQPTRTLARFAATPAIETGRAPGANGRDIDLDPDRSF